MEAIGTSSRMHCLCTIKSAYLTYWLGEEVHVCAQFIELSFLHATVLTTPFLQCMPAAYWECSLIWVPLSYWIHECSLRQSELTTGHLILNARQILHFYYSPLHPRFESQPHLSRFCRLIPPTNTLQTSWDLLYWKHLDAWDLVNKWENVCRNNEGEVQRLGSVLIVR